MEYPTLFLPVKCPICGLESLSEFPEIVVTVALTRWNHIAHYAKGSAASGQLRPRESARAS